MITLNEPCSMPEEQLTAPQQTALTSLILGKSVTAAAGEAGVHRNTVHRWLRNDEHFQEAKHQTQREARAAVEAKLHDTAKAAVDCIEKCLREGDVYVAEQLLKGLGCFEGKLRNLGSEDAIELAQQALHQSALGEMFGERGAREARSEIGGRKSAQAEGEGIGGDDAKENLQPCATSDESETNERAPRAQPDLREMERYASVFTKPEETDAATMNPQHDATSTCRSRTCVPDPDATSPPPAPTSDFRSPTSIPQPTAPSNDSECNNPPHDLPESDVITVEHAGHACEIDGYAELTAQQTLAMFALQTGQTTEEAAETAETDAATVYQWLRDDYTFQAAMNCCAGERRQSIQSRLAGLASRAADVIDGKVCQGNGRMAVKVLRGLGYLAARRV